MASDELVVSGLSGRFPEADDIDELAQNLYNHVDMVSDGTRWPSGLYGTPSRSGKLKDLSKFDNQFFGINGKQADYMDPQSRLLLETTYEALIDAGLDVSKLRGSRTGVYLGIGQVDSHESLSADASKTSGYVMTGNHPSMLANRISYCFDLRGPSNGLETACSSAMIAFHQAVMDLQMAQCDMAIVGSANVCLKPVKCLQLNQLNLLSPEGKCKFLDAGANGYARSEACAVLILQKSNQAKRVYARVVGTGTNADGHKSAGFTVASWEMQSDLIKSVHKRYHIDPNDLIYMEADGSGSAEGDLQECQAIADAICSKRQKPLPIGSVKTNLGHSEVSSGICSIAKICIALQNSKMPGILHFNDPNENIESLSKGLIKPCLMNYDLPESGLFAINSFGFGGSNVYAVFRPNNKMAKPKNGDIVDGKIPRIVLLAGRTAKSCQYVIDWIRDNPTKVTREFLALLNDVFCHPSQGLNYRSWMLIDKTNENHKLQAEWKIESDIKQCIEKRPLWFVFPGMGCQWPTMGVGMMQLPMFMDSIRKSSLIFEDYDEINIIDLITNPQENPNFLKSILGMVVIQIGLVDCLFELGIKPDGMLGHSFGETICAYVDGTLDRKQLLLTAYWLGKCTIESRSVEGRMAAVGLGWEETKRRIELIDGSKIVPACHNSDDSVTIAGPETEVEEFVSKLKKEDIFARVIDSSGVAFHSPSLLTIQDTLLTKFRDIIPTPKERSSKWVCSSLPESRWFEDLARFSSPEYFANNLVSPVLFKEALEKVPKNANLVEIAPHCLLRSILKQSIGKDSVYMPLMKRNNNEKNMELFFSAIGSLYQLGFQPTIEKLYPEVQYPVSRGTQSLSPLVKWDHSQSWLVTRYPEYFNPSSNTDSTFKCDINEADDEYLADHCVDGRVLFPATGYLMLAWKALAKCRDQSYDKMPVLFENVSLHRATILTKTTPANFVVQLMQTSGDFSISEGGNIIVTGEIFAQPEESPLQLQSLQEEALIRGPIYEEEIVLTKKEVYKELRVRGYDYGPQFQGLHELNLNSHRGKLAYNGNWISFADAMLQLAIMSGESRAYYLPVKFQSIRCDPIAWKNLCEESSDHSAAALYDPHLNVIVAPGLEICGHKFSLAPRNLNAMVPQLESYQFVANCRSNALAPHENKLIVNYHAVCARALCQLAENAGTSLSSLVHSDVSRRIMQIGRVVDDKLYAKVMISVCDQMKLLARLKQIIESVSDDQAEVERQLVQLLANKRLMQADLLSNIHAKESILRPYIDIVLENIASPRLKVLEINATSGLVVNQLEEFPRTLTNPTDLEYTVALVEYSDMQEVAQQMSGTVNRTIQWDLSKSCVPSNQNNFDLIIYKDSPEHQVDWETLIASIYDSVKPYGFAIVLLRTKLTDIEKLICIDAKPVDPKNILQLACKSGFELICDSSDLAQTSKAILFRRPSSQEPELHKQTIIKVTNQQYNWVDELRESMNSLVNRDEGENIWLVAEDDANSGIVGLVNCLRLEPGGRRVRSIFNQSGNADLVKRHFSDIIKRNLVSNVLKPKADIDLGATPLEQISGTYRHLRLKTDDEQIMIQTDDAYLNVVNRGDLTSLRWFDGQNRYWSELPTEMRQPNEQRCSIYYSPLNFRDVMLASGKLPPDALPGAIALQDCVFGLEFAGQDQTGRRVMGCVPAQGFATSILVNDPEFLWPIPDVWSMEEASTVPVAYATAYYALIVRGKLNKGESVLIHSAAGGVGQAAISICLARGCRVFCTVGSPEKRNFLKIRFPELKDEDFANSRDCSFEQHVLRHTNGNGCDVLLNSLSGDKLQASVRALATHGRFLEIGKYDLSQNNPLGMAAFLKNIVFHGILLDSLFVTGKKLPLIIRQQKKQVARLMQEGIASGEVRPLKRKVFEHHQVEQAFRYMASGRHIGKIVVKIRDEEKTETDKPLVQSSRPIKLAALPRTTFHPLKSYIITGGLGGFGLELAYWLVQRGSRNLILTSRTGPRDAFQKMSIERLKQAGAKILIYTRSVATTERASKLIKAAGELGPVGGIFNLAMVLRDAIMTNQTVQNYELVCEPKVQTTIALDEASRKLCRDSCDYFVAFSSVSCGRGNPGQSNYGYANSVMERVCELRCAHGLHGLAVQWGAIGDVGVISETTSGSNDINIAGTRPQRIPSCLSTLDKFLNSQYPVCSSFVQHCCKVEPQTSDKANLLRQICKILGTNADNVPPSTTLAELGMDSLAAVEIEQLLERDYATSTTSESLRNMTVDKLKHLSELK